MRTHYDIICAWCGAAHRTRRADGRYCSEQCAQLDLRKRRQQVVLWTRPDNYAEQRRAALTAPTPAPRWFQAGQCRACGKWFVSRHTHNTCSDECDERMRRDAKRNAAHRRRARQRNAFVEPVYRTKVYERDGWTCRICGRRLKREATVPHPLAPTIDHVVPISQGGAHAMANVRAAHFLCNSSRGDREKTVQEMLFG